MIFYHYTSAENYHSMQQPEGKRLGLQPYGRFMPISIASRFGLPSKASNSAIFGLLSPLDNAWCTNTFHFEEPLLETVVNDISSATDSLCLLEVTVLPTDDIYVADYSPHLAADYTGLRGEESAVRRVKTNYWESLVPFSDYEGQPVSHQIPEVISFTPIPIDRINLVGIYNRHNLINAIRAEGGFELEKPLRPVDRSGPYKIFSGNVGSNEPKGSLTQLASQFKRLNPFRHDDPALF